MNQVKWNKIDSFEYELLRADLMRTLWTEDVENPAYPKNDSDKEEVDDFDSEMPENFSTSTLTFTMGGANYNRGVSGYIFEKLKFKNRNSIQAQFWSALCDLCDSSHRFTIAWNNDAWFSLDDQYPEDDASEEDWEEYHRLCDEKYEEKDEAMLMLETDIIDLSRTICKKSENKTIEYSEIIKFIKLNKTIDWYEHEWEKAVKILLSMLESFFVAVKDKDFFSLYLDQFLPTAKEPHFDWRINPMLRDIFLGFLISNPFLVNDKGIIMKNQELFKLVFDGMDDLEDFLETKINIDTKFEEQIVIENFEKIIDKKFENSSWKIPDKTADQIKKFMKQDWGNYFVET